MRSWVLPAHNYVLLLAYLMSRPGGYSPPPFAYGQPQRLTDVAVATAPPSTTDISDDSAATTATGTRLVSATTAAEINYPVGQLTINNIDTVVVDYNTAWTDATLGVTCTGEGVGGTRSFDLPLSSTDTVFTLEPIADELTISTYPISCELVLRDASSVADFVVGGTLEITSGSGVATTYGISTTKAAENSNTATATGARDSSGPSSTLSAIPTSGSSNTSSTAASPTSTGVAGSSSEDATSSSARSSGSSSAAKAGIAIGVLLAVGLILVGVWFLYRQRRRMHRMETELAETKRQHESKRANPDGISKVGGKSDTRNGARVVMTEAPHRGSGEWKKFFNARAPSAGGTAPPSRLGTATEALPQLVEDGRSTPGADAASTTGLVKR